MGDREQVASTYRPTNWLLTFQDLNAIEKVGETFGCETLKLRPINTGLTILLIPVTCNDVKPNLSLCTARSIEFFIDADFV